MSRVRTVSIDGRSVSRRRAAQSPARLLESSQVVWKRDFDAVLVGVVLGVLMTLVVQAAW